MKKSISRYTPIILVEFNKENIKKIFHILSGYLAYAFNYKEKKFIKINNNTIHAEKSVDIARSKKTNLLSIRNIFFIPKTKLNMYKHLFN